MPTTRNSPTIGLNLRALPLSALSSHCLAALPAKMSAFNSYSTCGITPNNVTWSATSKFVAMLLF